MLAKLSDNCRHGKLLILSIILAVRSHLVAADGEFVPAGPYSANLVGALPTFVIIGVAKGGTTDLYEQLADVGLNSDPSRKEPPIFRGPIKEAGFFDGELEPDKKLEQLGDYLRILGHPCANITDPDDRRRCMEAKGANFLTLDATPTYIFLPMAPMQLAAMSPSTKAIAMLRDPVQRAEILFRHFIVDQNMFKDYTMDKLTDQFFQTINESPIFREGLDQLAATEDVTEAATIWRRMRNQGILRGPERQIFSGGLYVYALAAWRTYHFKPGRYMVIDSNEYYTNRVAVMQQVVHFLYGRSLNPTEFGLASKEIFWRKAASDVSKVSTEVWKLSPERHEKLQAFFDRHVVNKMPAMLSSMRQNGGWVLGFQGAPWNIRSV